MSTRQAKMREKKIYEQYNDMLRRNEGAIIRICLIFAHHTTYGVEDLYQDIAMELWRHYGGFRNESAESTWVYRVALTTACRQVDRHRKEPRTVPLSLRMAERLAEEGQDELVGRLYELIELLPNEEKRLAFLYLEGVPVRQMAKILNCSEREVGRRIFDMKQALNELNKKEKL